MTSSTVSEFGQKPTVVLESLDKWGYEVYEYKKQQDPNFTLSEISSEKI